MAEPISLRAYGRRRGVSVQAVSRAIATERLRESVVWRRGIPKIADPDLADREWTSNTDLSRAPDYVKARGGQADQSLAVPPEHFSVFADGPYVVLACSPNDDDTDAALVFPVSRDTALQLAERLTQVAK